MSLQVTEVDEQFIARMEEHRAKPEASGMAEAGSKSLPFFAEHMLGLRLWSWQVDFLVRVQKAIEGKYWTREFHVLTSRQIGKTTASAVLLAWIGVYNKCPGTILNNSIMGIVSAADKQAKNFLNEVRKLLRAGDAKMETYVDDSGIPKFGKTFFTNLLDDNEPNNTEQMTFKKHNPKVHGNYLLAGSKIGSTIRSFAPTDTILGNTFTVIIVDEAGRSEKVTDEVFRDFIYPTGNKYKAIRIYLSTPWQASGFFYEMANKENPSYDRLAFSVEAVKYEDPEYYESVMQIVREMNEDGKVDEVQRGYYCVFSRGDAAYFDPEKTRGVFTDEYKMFDMYTGECDMGIDFGGQTKSRTVITISTLDEKTGRIRRLYHKRYPVQGDLNLVDDVAHLLTRFNIQRIIPDDCPAGWHIIRQMEERGWSLEPMNFKAEKIKKYGAFRASVNRGLVESYTDKDLLTEMLALEQTKGKVTTQIAAPTNYTDDMIDSFVMSCYFYVQDDSNRVRFIHIDL